MGYFLLFLLIFFVVIPLGKAIYQVYKLRKQTRRFFEQMHRDMTGEEPPKAKKSKSRGFGFGFGRGAASSDDESRPPKSRKKKIPADVGEYVAFEERSLTREEIDEIYTSAEKRKTRFRSESQVTDVEWEEIHD